MLPTPIPSMVRPGGPAPIPVLLAALLLVDAGASAPTREEQDAAIALHRKGTIRIVAPAGTSLRIRQSSHEFRFGTAVSESVIGLGANHPDYRKFTEIAGKYFNSATDEYAQKWDFVEPVQGRPDWTKADLVADWSAKLGFELRGHTIYWPHLKWMPEWIKNGSDATVLSAIDRRGEETTARFRDRIQEWDVNNEMVHYRYFADRFGTGVVKRMFQAARRGHPTARLFTNEHEILSKEWSEPYYAHVDSLLKTGVEVAGIGMQGHLWDASSAIISGKTDRAEATLDGAHEVLEKFSGLGLPIRITEYDFGSSDEEKKAKKLRDFYRLFFSKPYVAGISMWGFWQGRHWRPDAHLWDRAWKPLPAANAYIDLVWKEWMTDTTVIVPSSGSVDVRGFFGRYEITIGGAVHAADLRKSEGGFRIDASGNVSTGLRRDPAIPYGPGNPQHRVDARGAKVSGGNERPRLPSPGFTLPAR